MIVEERTYIRRYELTLSSSGLSPQKDLAARLLSQGYTQVEVAKDARIGVTKQTMNNWCKSELFQERIKEFRTDLLKQAEEVFARNVGEAAEAIVEIAVGRPMMTIVKDGEEIEVPVDNKLIASKLKAALFIIDRTMGKRMPTAEIKKEPLEEDEQIDDGDVEDVLGFANAE